MTDGKHAQYTDDLNPGLFGFLAASNVIVSVKRLFTEMTTLLAAKTPNVF